MNPLPPEPTTVVAQNLVAVPVEPVKPVEVAPVVVAPVKPIYKQWTNLAAVVVGTVGNALPYITPAFLTSLGLSTTTVHTTSTIVAFLLAMYKERVKPTESPK